MCMSAEASFTVVRLLMPAGFYCVRAAVRKKRTMLPLAAIPFFFGFQQLTEGVVWRAIHADDADSIQRASVLYLFFAVPFWPFWISFCHAVSEQRLARKRVLCAITALSVAWFWLLYLPLAENPDRFLETRVVHHSIQYQFSNLPIFGMISGHLVKLLYVANIVVPLVLGSKFSQGGVVFGVLVAIFAVISATVYWYAFISVWCLFAACTTFFECIIFYQLPEPHFEAMPAAQQAAANLSLE